MLKTIASQIKEYKLPSIMTPIFMIVEVIMEMVIPYLMASIIDKGINASNINHIYKVGFIMILCSVIGLFGGLMGAKYGAKASTGLAKNLRKTMYENIQTFSFENIDKFSTAGLVTRMTTDVTNIQNAYQMILRMCMRSPISLIMALSMAFFINSRLALIYVIAIVFLGICLVFILKYARKYFTIVFEKYDALNSNIQENLRGIRVVKSFVREDFETEKFSESNNNLYKLFCSAESMVVLNAPLMTFTVYACILAISYLGAHMIVSNMLTTGELMSLIAYCMNILMSLMMLSMIFVMLTMSAAAAQRVAEVINEKSTIVNPENPKTEIKNGSIEYRNVMFNYNKGDGEPELENINITIKSGETIGIIGATGSSKTTFINLISRLYDVDEGEVLVGGINVKEYDLEALRNAVSVVLQKNELFSGTILDNLRWGKSDATLEECKHVCKIACADEFIDRMEKGYDTYIEQSGNNVSGGQKQRLCIARALLKNPKILILDDSTSAVDTATDAKIRNALAKEAPDTTKIIIAQRISSIQHADRIIVFDDGKINQIGTHDELIETNDIYKDVYESQTQGSGDFDENK